MSIPRRKYGGIDWVFIPLTAVETAGEAQMRQLREKAQVEGLTVKEVNDIARVHARDLSAYNLNGELSSGLAKQAAENTRRGLKDTARSNFGNKISEEADRVISDLSRLKKIASDRATAVERIKTQTLSPTFMQRAGGLLEQAINIATLGSSRALMSVALQGAAKAANKAGTRMNALDLEKKLADDLKLIQDAAKKGASEEDIISKLQQFIKNNGEKPVLLLEAPKPSTLFATAGGRVTPVAQEAADIASVEAGKAKIPKTGPLYKQKVKEIQERLEPYLTPEEMKVIKMGPAAPKRDYGVPTVDSLPNVYANPRNVQNALRNKLERYLTPEEMEVIDFGPPPKKKKSLSDIYID